MASNCQAIALVVAVERRISNRETLGSGPAPTSSDDPSDAALSADHRICCSRRRNSEYASAATSNPFGSPFQDDVNYAASRSHDRHLEVGLPPPVEPTKHRLDHSSLVAVGQTWPGTRIETDAQIGSQGRGNSDECLDARIRQSGLYSRVVRAIDARKV